MAEWERIYVSSLLRSPMHTLVAAFWRPWSYALNVLQGHEPRPAWELTGAAPRCELEPTGCNEQISFVPRTGTFTPTFVSLSFCRVMDTVNERIGQPCFLVVLARRPY